MPIVPFIFRFVLILSAKTNSMDTHFTETTQNKVTFYYFLQLLLNKLSILAVLKSFSHKYHFKSHIKVLLLLFFLAYTENVGNKRSTFYFYLYVFPFPGFPCHDSSKNTVTIFGTNRKCLSRCLGLELND